MIEYIWNKILKKIRGRAIKNSVIDKTSKVEAGTLIVNSTMHRYSFCGYDCKIINTEIGSFCSIADGVIIGGAQHPINWVSTSPVFYKGRDSVSKKFSEYSRVKDKKTIIGNDVWIGDRAIIKAGVTIGNGSIVGMGAVITKNVGDYEIWAGNPAKLIRKRFDEFTIFRLKKSKWWKRDEEYIKSRAIYIKEPDKFLNS